MQLKNEDYEIKLGVKMRTLIMEHLFIMKPMEEN